MAWIVILAALAVIRIVAMSAYPIMDSTEARFAEVARKMAAIGDYITPRYLHDEPYWGKPPLYFWVTALSIKLFGATEIPARLPSFLFSIATVVVTYFATKRLYGKEVAGLAAVILASTALFFGLSGVVITDTALTCWITLSLAAFIVRMHGDSDAKGSGAWGWLFFIGLAMSLLTKGPIGAVLTLLPIATWAVIRGKIRDVFRRFPVVAGTVLVAVISIPWYVLAELKTPGFLEYYIVGEHWKRFVVSGWEGSLYGGSHKFVRGTIWAFMAGGAMPWLIVLGAAAIRLFKLEAGRSAVRALATDDRAFFLLCWFLWPAIFFTMAGNILYTYVLPGLSGFAILTASAISAAASRSEKEPWFAGSWTTAICTAFAPVVLIALVFTSLDAVAARKSQKELVRFYLSDRQSPADEIVYYGQLTFSADFYANGAARDIPGMQLKLVQAELDDDNRDYFAVKNDEVYDFTLKTQDRVKTVKQFAKYTLFVEI